MTAHTPKFSGQDRGESAGMDATSDTYDVIIVGGRPAGASLAARLGARGHRVLVLDRADMPSLPAVPSSPVIYPSSMNMLEELGIAEAEYQASTARMDRLHMYFDRHVRATFEVPPMWGRSYLCGIDRAGFDAVLWRHLDRFATVERRAGFAVSDLARDADGRVVGVVGRERGGPLITLRGRCVIGADGRFSLVARKAGAAITESEDRYCSTVYYANWEGVNMDDATSGAVHATGRGLDVIFFRMPGCVQVNTHERADRALSRGDAKRYYADALARVTGVAERMQGARQIDELVGIKRIGNGYRQAGGPGWLLVGDAVHYKDPADGQGIYDALLGAKLADRALAPWLVDECGWDQVVAEYQATLLEATRPMYLETLARLKKELYSEPPVFIIKTLIRWTLTDPTYQRRFIEYLGRAIEPTGWSSPGRMAGAALRGIWRDLSGRSRARA